MHLVVYDKEVMGELKNLVRMKFSGIKIIVVGKFYIVADG